VADNAHEERFQQHEDILRSLTAMLAAQHEMNRQQAELNRQQAELNRHRDVMLQQQVEINQDVKTTLARIEALLARIMRTEDNGRDA
jgi:hypothetical protein